MSNKNTTNSSTSVSDILRTIDHSLADTKTALHLLIDDLVQKAVAETEKRIRDHYRKSKISFPDSNDVELVLQDHVNGKRVKLFAPWECEVGEVVRACSDVLLDEKVHEKFSSTDGVVVEVRGWRVGVERRIEELGVESGDVLEVFKSEQEKGQ
ncbi:uncharacterized protein LTR77_008666 [Saxophila tyrrhenica]|uniref:Uncharacterized protein n=1 Tax=Saxophila tyrrhenica TaxID=1690608 RepID=A0AAV9NZS1_9PEZI|nr:hypothetical protein LTR77_008666 [Saxophila tyrrhenica]